MANTVGNHAVTTFTSPVNGDALDATVVRGNDNTLRTAYVSHDADPGIHLQSSALASRPAAGIAGRKWMTTDAGVNRIWHDNGTAWEEISYLSTGGTVSFSGLTVTGNTTLGDANTDTLSITAELITDIIPDVNNTYNLGSAAKKWAEVNVVSLLATTVAATGAITGASSSVTGNAQSQSLTVTTGTITVNGVAYSWPNVQGAANTVLSNNGSGTLSWVAATGLIDNTVADGTTTYSIGTSDAGRRLVLSAPRVVEFTTANTNAIAVGQEVAILADTQTDSFGEVGVLVNPNNSPTVSTAFVPPSINGVVRTIIEQSDGKVLIFGDFTLIGGTTRNYGARLNVDGTLDSGFNPNFNGAVYTAVLQANGKVVVGGTFTTIGGNAQARLGRLNTDGTWDSSWTATSASIVNRLLQGPNGTIYMAAGTTLSRLLSTGSADSAWTNVTADNTIEAIWQQPNGAIIGFGSSITDVSGSSRTRMWRTNPFGGSSGLDNSFTPSPNGVVYGIAVLPNGDIAATGDFTNIGGASRTSFAVLDRITGTAVARYRDASFGGTVLGNSTPLLQPDGGLLLLGSFTQAYGTSRTGIMRLRPGTLLPDGSWTTNTSAAPNFHCAAIIRTQGVHGYYLSGSFSTVGGLSRTNIVRIDVATDAVSCGGAAVIPPGGHAVFRKMANGRWATTQVNALQAGSGY